MSETLINVDVNATPSKRLPPIAKRLADSPKTLFPSTPEKNAERQEKAASTRKILFEQKVAKAHADVELAQKRSAERKDDAPQ